MTLTSHRRYLTSTSGGASPFHRPPRSLSAPIFIRSVPALPWNDTTSQRVWQSKLTYSILILKPSKETSKMKCPVLKLSVVIWMPCLYWRVMYSDIGRYGPIRRYGLHHSSGRRTPIWVPLLILWYGLHYSALLLWAGQCYNMRTPTNWNANQCVVSCWYQYHLSLAKSKKLENYFENIVCEIFNC